MKKIGGIIFIVVFVLLTASQSGRGAAQALSPVPSLTWERIETSKMPSPRTGFSLVLNETNQVALLFGGGASFEIRNLNDLWLTNGSQWLEFYTSHRPPERSGSSLAYDKDRKEAVLFGGAAHDYASGLPVALNDTWILNGFDWGEQTPAMSPSPRAAASMVYDPDHQRAYLFGGSYPAEYGTGLYNDTWAWDGTNWEQIQTNNQPDVRNSATMAYDPVHHNVLLYGGASIAAPLNDTWIWDGQAWTEQNPIHQPGRGKTFEYPKIVFDTSLQQIVLVGLVWDFPNSRHHTETWAWDGQDWVELAVVRPLPEEILWHGKLVYLPGLQAVAIVNLFPQKFLNPDGSSYFIDRSEVWALVNRNFIYVPLVSR